MSSSTSTTVFGETLAPRALSHREYLIEPTIVPAPQILNVEQFDNYHAIILADVPRLPADTALFVGRLADTPKMKGQRPGSVRWSREHVAAGE